MAIANVNGVRLFNEVTGGILPFRRPSDPTPQELLEGMQAFDGWAVNVRRLEGINADGLPIKRVYGSRITLETTLAKSSNDKTQEDPS